MYKGVLYIKLSSIVLALFLSILAEISVGVKNSDLIGYSVSYTGNPPDTYPKSIKIEVERIQGTNITARWDIERINGEKYFFSEMYDLRVGFYNMIFVESGLEIGDEFFHYQIDDLITIKGTEEHEYAGEKRTIVWSSFLENSVYWDKNTGVLTEADWIYSSTLRSHWVLRKTNLWGPTGFDTIMVLGMALAVSVIFIIFLLINRKRR